MRFALAMTLAVTLAGAAHAADPQWNPPSPDRDTPTEAAVRRCVEYVRRTTPPSTFDAYTYVAATGYRFSWYGTPEETFLFKKCLAGHGITFATTDTRSP